MGGLALSGMAMAQGGLGVLQGGMQSSMYDIEAQQAGMDAKSAELGRRRDLQDALAMQAVITGASGRAAGVGSTQTIMQEDMRRAEEDISMIRAGGKAKQASLKSAGKTAQFSSITSGLLSAAKTGYQAGQVK